jgi:hypothetical protein
MWPDGSGVVFIDLRRLHNLDEQRHNKGFVVTRRLKVDGKSLVVNKWHDTLREARVHWLTEASKLEDQGMTRLDFTITGFHEED